MMLSKTVSAASAALFIMLVVYYYIDESSLVLVILFALSVTNDYTMETIVMSMIGLGILAIIGTYIGSAGLASADAFAASAALFIMLVVYYCIDESSLVLVLLFALSVANDYTMETVVMSKPGFVILAIIGVCIGGSAGLASLSITSGNLVGTSRTQIDCYEECQEELTSSRVRFNDDVSIHIIDNSEEERIENLQVIQQIYACLKEKQTIDRFGEDRSLNKIKQTCNTSNFRQEASMPLYAIQINHDDTDDDIDDRFEHVEEEEEISNINRPNRHMSPKRRRKGKLKRSFKPRRSPRLMGAKCTRSGRCYG